MTKHAVVIGMSAFHGPLSSLALHWEEHVGHEAIGRAYSVQHPTSVVFLNTVDLYRIVEKGGLGDPERLPEFVRRLRPDITDTRILVLFELKPDNEKSREIGRKEAGCYLAALNEVAEPDKKLVGGTSFEGSLFLEFENGGALWQLSWRTPEPEWTAAERARGACRPRSARSARRLRSV